MPRRTKVFAAMLVLASGAAVASAITAGGSGGGGASPVDVLAALVGQNVNANSYTATATTGPAFNSTGNLVDAYRLGTGPRATIGTCNSGGICLGPNDGSIGTMVFISGSFVSKSAQVQGPLDMLGVDAYLINNNSTDPVRVEDADGFRINGTSPIKGVARASVTYDAPALSNNTCSPQSVTVTGAALGDYVTVNADFALPTGVAIGNARVTAANTVELTLCNITAGGALDPTSGPYLFRLER